MKYARIELRIGDDATQAFKDAITGHDDDILLAVEKAIQKRIYARNAGDPFTDPMGVFVDLFEVDS